jgi:hypothetical protein
VQYLVPPRPELLDTLSSTRAAWRCHREWESISSTILTQFQPLSTYDCCRGFTNSTVHARLDEHLLQLQSPATCVREEALDAILGLFLEAIMDASLQPGLQLAINEIGGHLVKVIGAAITNQSDPSSSDDVLSLSPYQVQRGAEAIQSVLHTASPTVASRMLLYSCADTHKVKSISAHGSCDTYASTAMSA